MATFFARRTVLSLNLATFSRKYRLIPVVSRCVCLPYKYYQLFRQCSSIKEGSIPQNQEASPDLELSDSCVKQLHKIFADDKESFLRVSVEGGGCSGFMYTFDIDTDISDEDRVIEKDGARVVIDDISLEYIKGSTVDFQEELIRSAFKISFNPKAEKGCSCGSSFTFKL
ncbi:Iron-sulfur cluster assembly 2 [Porites harrisoni]